MFEFLEENVPTKTTDEVRAVLGRNDGCLVTGAPGSGKSHAVREAVNGAIWVNLDTGDFQTTRFFVDLARQVDGGAALLEMVAQQRLDDATRIASELLGPRCLVVDRAERLVHDVDLSWGDPLHTLGAAQNADLATWLLARSGAPTVLLSRRTLPNWQGALVSHKRPTSWALKLQRAPDGYRDWQRLTQLIDQRPGGMTLARAVIPLTGPHEFARLMDQAEQLRSDGDGPNQVLRILAGTLAQRAPAPWRRVFTLVAALDGAPRSIIESVLDADDHFALAWLRDIRLIEERDERLTVLPLLRDFAGDALESADHRELLGKAAHDLLTRVNDPETLKPAEADFVFRAHTLFVRRGDFANARKTATLHATGLIDLAKRTSQNRDWQEARRLYTNIIELLEHKWGELRSTHSRRSMSYAIHYRGYNDERVSQSSSVQVLHDYERSIDLWPENALWRQRQIEAFIRRGDFRRAQASVDAAYSTVKEHPRRDTILRVRPALTATHSEAPLFGLELLAQVEVTFNQDPEGAGLLNQINDEWDRGVPLRAAPRAQGELIFRNPIRVSVQHKNHKWRAQTIDFHSKLGRGDTALAAVRDLADKLGDEARTLLSTPSHLLDDDPLARKSELITYIDPLNSDLGLEHASHRWLLGRLEHDSFVPLQRKDFDPISLPPSVRGDHESLGEYFAKVPVYRDGRPSGPVEELRPAGSGRPLRELLSSLAELRK